MCLPGAPSDIMSTVGPQLLNTSVDDTSESSTDMTDATVDTRLSNDDGVLVADEERRSGVVRLSVYWSYWMAVGRCLASLVLLSIVLMQGLTLSSVIS